jgi:hypothetical protein
VVDQLIAAVVLVEQQVLVAQPEARVVWVLSQLMERQVPMATRAPSPVKPASSVAVVVVAVGRA